MRDYVKLLDWLRSSQNACYIYGCDECPADCENHEGDIFKDAADAIEELVAAVPKWISVEDRLPHYLDHVLCVNKFGIQMVGYLTDYKEGGFRCESGMDSCDYITHWMPLPALPKEV